MNTTYTIKVVCDPTAETFRERVRYDITDDEFGLVAVTFYTLNEAAAWISRPRCTWWTQHPDMGPGTYVTEMCRDEATTRLVLRDDLHDDADADGLWSVCAFHAGLIREDVTTGEALGFSLVHDDEAVRS